MIKGERLTLTGMMSSFPVTSRGHKWLYLAAAIDAECRMSWYRLVHCVVKMVVIAHETQGPLKPQSLRHAARADLGAYTAISNVTLLVPDLPLLSD